MKGYIMYKVGHVTFKKEYVKNIHDLDRVDFITRFTNFKYGIIPEEQHNVKLVFKGKEIDVWEV